MSDAREPEEPSRSAAKTSRVSAGWSRLFDRLRFLKRHIVAVAAVGAVLSGLVGYWTTYRTVHEVIAPAALGNTRPGAQSPPAMSVVVAPLTAPKDDAAAVRFADTLTHNLVSRLGRLNGWAGRLRLVAFQGDPAGEAIGLGELGRRLNVRYLLEGNVLRGGEGNAVNLRLVDAATGGQVWSARSTLQASDVSAEASVNLRNLSTHVRTAVVDADIRRAVAEPASTLNAPELLLRALAAQDYDQSLAGILEARKLVDQALRLDPNWVPALLTRAHLTGMQLNLDPKADRGRILREVDEDSARAVDLDSGNSLVWSSRSAAMSGLGRWDAALEANATAIKLDPDDAEFVYERAALLTATGHPAGALPLIDRALELDSTVRTVRWSAYRSSEAYLLPGQAEQAVTMCEKATTFFSDNLGLQVMLVAAYASHGDIEKAAAAKAKLLRMAPRYTVAQARASDQPSHPEYAKLAEKYFYEGLRKAGIPEQ